LAKKHHPDTHSNDAGAKKRFQEISAAYDIVGDKDKRAKFDAGEIDAEGHPRGFDPGAHGFSGGPFGGGGPGARDFHFTWTDAEGNTAHGFRAQEPVHDRSRGGGAGGG